MKRSTFRGSCRNTLLLTVFILSVEFLTAQKIETDLVYKVNMPVRKSGTGIPCMIFLHGYGSNEADLFELSRSFDDRFITFSVRAPYKAEGGSDGYAWYELKRNATGEMQHKYKETAESRKKLTSFISKACKAYGADSTQVFLMGFSQGAIMCFEMAFANPGKYKAVLPLSGILLKETRELKPKESALIKTAFYIAHGTEDNLIKAEKSKEAFTYLQLIKANVTLNTYPIPHSISGQELNDINQWLKKQLKEEKKK